MISSLGSGSGAARVPVLSVNLTAGTASGVTVSAINFHKVGVLSDSAVSGAYLTQNGQVLYQYNSLNNGVLTFSGMSLNIPAGQTVELTLAIDVAGGLSAGNTAAFSLNAASDVTAFDANNNALTAAGSFPMNGSIFTVTNVQNPSLASINVGSSSIGTTVTAGTQNDLVGAWNFTVQNSKVYLKGLSFHVVGSAQLSNIQNVILKVNGTQVGPTLASVPANGVAYFNASATPGVLNTGNNNIQVYANVMGSPSYNFQFEILNSYDILALDSQYNVPVTAGSNSGTQITIQNGTITTTQDASTPTGNIAVGQSQVTLAKFDIYAAGEPVKVQYLPFSLSFTGVNTASDSALNQLVQNVAITDDAGGQVGTTINQPPSSGLFVSASKGMTTAGTLNSSNVTYQDSFGSPSSPINYVVPANTTRVLSLKADIQSTANFQTVTAALVQPSGQNLQGMISSQLAKSSGATGSALTLATSLLTAGQNNALGNQTVAAGVAGLKVGSYALTASSADGVNVSNLSITLGTSATTNGSGPAFQNLLVKVNGAQFGTTQSTVSNGGQYSFSGTPFLIPEGGTVNVDVYADTLSTATGTATNATTLSSVSGTGQNSFTSVSMPAAVPGQSVTFGSADSLIISSNQSQPAANYITMGSNGNQLAAFNLQESGNLQNLNVTSLTVQDHASAGTAEFSNLKLMQNGSVLSTSGAAESGTVTVTVPQVAASSTLTVSFPAALATSTYSVNVTANGITTAYGTVSLNGASSTLEQETAVATAIASQATASSSALGIASATSNTNTVVLISSGITNMNASASIWTLGQITTAVNNAGVASYTTTQAAGAGTFTYTFTFPTSNPLVVPKNNQIALQLVGDAASYSAQPGNDGATHTFSIAGPSSVIVNGASTNLPLSSSNVTGSALGNTMTVVQSSMSIATAQPQTTAPSNMSALGTITLNANSAGPVSLYQLAVDFTNTVPSSTEMSNFIGSMYLSVGGTATNVTSTGATVGTTTDSSGNGTVVTWTFPVITTASSSPLTVNSTAPVVLTINGNMNAFAPVANLTQTISASVANTGVVYYDHAGSTLTGTTVMLPASPSSYTVYTYNR